eukprot:jgi/Botrbrau1/132/Bobra.0022s0118.1
MKMDWTWKRFLYDYPEGLFKLKLNATNNTLTTADNIRRWTNEHVRKHCAGCQRSCSTLKHVLTGCPTFLFQGRYKWRHDSVLSTIFSVLSSFLSSISHDSEDSKYISFVKEGQKHGLDRSHPGTSVPRRKLRCGSLGNFQDWVLIGDGLSCPYHIPQNIVVTALRPDIFMYSASARKCILIKVTVPFEDRVFIAASGKANKYFELQTQIISAGCECELYTVEIGCCGNYAASLRHCLIQLGLPRRHARRVCSCATKTALSCSYYIFLKRNNSLWEV